MYPNAEKIVIVTDNLNIHATASLYKVFEIQEARRLAERFEWHYTPKHGNWLDMVEIELSILSRQALAKPKPDKDSLSYVVSAWTESRNDDVHKIHWHFSTSDARIKPSKFICVYLTVK